MDAADQLTAEERLARWMGWEEHPSSGWWRAPLTLSWTAPPAYATDANAWPAMHAEIERRGLAERFIDEMFMESCADIIKSEDDVCAVTVIWRLFTATPAQRLAAMMRVIEGEA